MTGAAADLPRTTSPVGEVTRQPAATLRDQVLRWDLRRGLDPRSRADLEARLRRDPVRPLERPAPPDPAAWSKALAAGILDIVAGSRPLPQLRRWVTPDLYSMLARRIAAGAPPAGKRMPARARNAHVYTVRPGVLEVAVLVADGPRTRAVAMRLEEFRGRWLTTAIEIG